MSSPVFQPVVNFLNKLFQGIKKWFTQPKINQKPGKVLLNQAWRDFFVGYFDFNGRTTVMGYWSVVIFTPLVFACLILLLFIFPRNVIEFLDDLYYLRNVLFFYNQDSFVHGVKVLFNSDYSAAYFAILLLIIPNVALFTRRIRDVGIKGRVLLLIYIFSLIFYEELFVFLMKNMDPFGGPFILERTIFEIFIFPGLMITLLPTNLFAMKKKHKILSFFFMNKNCLEVDQKPYQK